MDQQASSIEYDVIVIGSGPAGSAAAHTLSSNHIKVLVLDKEVFPRYKTCGGGVVMRAIKLLPFDITPVIETYSSSTDIYDFEGSIHFNKERDEPVIFMTMRKDLDNFLISAAIKMGAEFLDGQEVKDIKLSKDYCQIFTNNLSYKSKFIIAADGALSITAKKAGWNDNRFIVPALEYEVYVEDKPAADGYKGTARFDFGIVPNGYGWVFPKKDHLSIGVASMKKNNNKKLKILAGKYLEKLEIKNVIKIEKHGFIIPLSFRNTFAKDRVLLTGDAAGLADPLTGEGISYAIQSGQIAANAIIQAKLDENNVIKIYNDEINRIVQELKSAKFLSKLIYGNSKLRQIIFKIYGDKLCDIMLDIISGKKSYSQLLKDPKNYLRLLQLRKYKDNTKSLDNRFRFTH